ncbi:hypothetical protein, conserved [Trypanosoma brucei brucei TREU927]|uniref:Uncharacterized protein n=1 Tax=Trypanosoma brucei brucei (strain 927/4 GUTat10.1) TaxID=185431 RepID=Q57XE6_TRYB2|nr:hypothetical protein, conserved [Trypanosoma brucei brucei TREU927]AAX69705.1 hypothetical protein, conserved [Trypanosoma brucei]AAZ13010.1 hypothetical protein, conserved [Trypanosoma brucei brucei TREU927]
MSDFDNKCQPSLRNNLRSATETLNRLCRATPEQDIGRMLRGNKTTPQYKAAVTPSARENNTYPTRSSPAVATSASRAPGTAGEWANAFRLLQSQVYNCVVELDTERVVRSNNIREVEQTLSGHVGELRAMILQMKKENEYLTGVVRSLQKRVSPHRAGRSIGNGEHTITSAAPPQTMTTVAGMAALTERLEALEDTVARQQRVVGDRNTRLEGNIREMVGNAVNIEVERTRRIAREAARDCTDELVRTHLASIQAVLQSERQHQQKVDSASSDAVREVVQHFRRLEVDVQRRLQEMNSTITVIRQQQQQRESEIQELSVRVAQDVSAVERSVEAARRELQSGIAKNAQANEARAEATQLALEAAVAERAIAASKEVVMHRATIIDAAEAGAKQKEQQEEQRLLRRLEDAQRTNETVQRQQEKLEEQLKGLQSVVQELQQQLVEAVKASNVASADITKWKARIREALTTSEEARTLAQESTACAQKTEDSVREALARSGVQLKRLVADHENGTLLTQQLTEKLEATEARLASTRTVVDDLSERHKNSLLPMTARVETLHRSLQDIFGPKMEEISGSLVELKATVEQLQLNASSRSKSDARQLSDMRREYTTDIQQLKDCLHQQVREWKQECCTSSSTLKAAVDGLSDTVKLQEQSTTRREALHASAAEVAVLSDRVQALEAAREAVEWRVARGGKTSNLATATEGAQQSAGETTVNSSVGEPGAATDSELGNNGEVIYELRHRITAVEQCVRSREDNLQKLVRNDIQKEVGRLEQLVNRMDEENTSRMQLLRVQLSDDVATRCKGMLCEVETPAQRQLQLQVDRLRESLNPAKLIAAIEADVELQNHLSLALQDAFAPRVGTSESFVQMKRRLQKAEDELAEVKVHTREQNERMKIIESNSEKYMWESSNQTQGEGSAGGRSEVGVLLQLLQTSMKQLQEEQAAARRERELLRTTAKVVETAAPAVEVTSGEGPSAGHHCTSADEMVRSDLKTYLEGCINAVEAKVEAAAQSTADTLDVLKQSIEMCVSFFVDEVNASALLNPLFLPIEAGQNKLNVNTVKGLDGVLLFLWQHQCGLQAAVQALQDGSLGTLDLLQHHEEQLALLQPVGPLATHTAAQLERLAVSLGLPLDTDAMDEMEEEVEVEGELIEDDDNDDELMEESEELVEEEEDEAEQPDEEV